MKRSMTRHNFSQFSYCGSLCAVILVKLMLLAKANGFVSGTRSLLRSETFGDTVRAMTKHGESLPCRGEPWVLGNRTNNVPSLRAPKSFELSSRAANKTFGINNVDNNNENTIQDNSKNDNNNISVTSINWVQSDVDDFVVAQNNIKQLSAIVSHLCSCIVYCDDILLLERDLQHQGKIITSNGQREAMLERSPITLRSAVLNVTNAYKINLQKPFT